LITTQAAWLRTQINDAIGKAQSGRWQIVADRSDFVLLRQIP
jgi:hypothetical protein